MVAVTDFFICLLSTFYELSLVKDRRPLMFENYMFCWMWNVTWEFMVRFSLHLLAIQSIFRTIKILLPLRVLENRVLAVVITVDLVLILFFIIVRRVEQFPFFTEILGSCKMRKMIPSINISNWYRLRIPHISYLVLPLIFIFCCCELCSLKFAKSAARRTFRQRRLSCKKHSQ